MLAKQDETLAKHGEMLARHDGTLEKLVSKVDRQGELLDFINHQFFAAQLPDKPETAKLFFSKKRQPAFCYSKFLHSPILTCKAIFLHRRSW